MFFFFFFDDERSKSKTLDDIVFENLKDLRDAGFYSGSDEKLKDAVVHWSNDDMGIYKEEFPLMYCLWDVYKESAWNNGNTEHIVGYWDMKYHIYTLIQWLSAMPRYGLKDFDRLNARLHDLVVGKKNFSQDKSGQITYNGNDIFTITIERTNYIDFIWDSVWAILDYRKSEDKNRDKQIKGLLWWRNKIGPNVMIEQCLEYLKIGRQAWCEAEDIGKSGLGKGSRLKMDSGDVESIRAENERLKKRIEELEKGMSKGCDIGHDDEAVWKSHYCEFLLHFIEIAQLMDDKNIIGLFLQTATRSEKWLPEEIDNAIIHLHDKTFDKDALIRVLEKGGITINQLNMGNGTQGSQLPSPEDNK